MAETESNKSNNGNKIDVSTLKVTCSNLLSNLQVENLISNCLNLKNDDNVGTANESSEINAEFANSGVSHVFDDTQLFDSSETDISRYNRTDSTFNEHEATN